MQETNTKNVDERNRFTRSAISDVLGECSNSTGASASLVRHDTHVLSTSTAFVVRYEPYSILIDTFQKDESFRVNRVDSLQYRHRPRVYIRENEKFRVRTFARSLTGDILEHIYL